MTNGERIPERHPAPPEEPERCEFCDEPVRSCGCRADEAYEDARERDREEER